MKRLIFKYGTSRGQNTCGWNIVSLYVDGTKVAHQCGGGYDMRGACLGDWIQDNFQNELSGLNPSEFYFRRLDNGKNIVDGAVGFETMRRIIEAIGYELRYVAGTSKEDIWIILPVNNQ